MLLEILLIIASLFAYAIYKLRQVQSTYWQQQGVKCPPSQFPMGNCSVFNNQVFFRKKNVLDVGREQYKLMKGEKMYGCYLASTPCLTIIDPDLIKQILVKDFNHFVDRAGDSAKKIFGGNSKVDEIWRKQMASSSGETWKNTRSTFSPIFTSGKMKAMVCFITEVNKRLMGECEEVADKGTELELKQMFGKFSMDTIASCAFGVDAQSFTNPNSEFVKYARNIFRRDVADMVKIGFVMMPGGLKLLQLMKISIFKPKETNFFSDIIENTLSERKKSKTRRNDLIDMMLDAMKEDGKQVENVEDKDTVLSHEANKGEIDDITVIATALVMLIAGYDTTAQTLAYLVYEMAMNTDVQSKLQDEIDDAMEDSNSQLPDYNKIVSMEYLEMVLMETLRVHPAVGTLSRACTLDYNIPMGPGGTITTGSIVGSVKIPKGMDVFIDVAGLHSDPEYYPEPDKFNPEHFSKENKANRHPYAFLAFGQGPRNCVGMRFALLEAKIAIISLLAKYKVVKSERTVEKITLDPASGLGACSHGLYVRLQKRN